MIPHCTVLNMYFKLCSCACTLPGEYNYTTKIGAGVERENRKRILVSIVKTETEFCA